MSERDIVTELRAIASVTPGKQSLWDSTVAAWAADEIERLRKENAVYKAADYDALRTLNEREPS